MLHALLAVSIVGATQAPSDIRQSWKSQGIEWPLDKAHSEIEFVGDIHQGKRRYSVYLYNGVVGQHGVNRLMVVLDGKWVLGSYDSGSAHNCRIEGRDVVCKTDYPGKRVHFTGNGPPLRLWFDSYMMTLEFAPRFASLTPPDWWPPIAGMEIDRPNGAKDLAGPQLEQLRSLLSDQGFRLPLGPKKDVIHPIGRIVRGENNYDIYHYRGIDGEAEKSFRRIVVILNSTEFIGAYEANSLYGCTVDLISVNCEDWGDQIPRFLVFSKDGPSLEIRTEFESWPVELGSRFRPPNPKEPATPILLPQYRPKDWASIAPAKAADPFLSLFVPEPAKTAKPVQNRSVPVLALLTLSLASCAALVAAMATRRQSHLRAANRSQAKADSLP